MVKYALDAEVPDTEQSYTSLLRSKSHSSKWALLLGKGILTQVHAALNVGLP